VGSRCSPPWARRSEDLTHHKTEEKDVVLIARLAARLRCYVPEPVEETRAEVWRVTTTVRLVSVAEWSRLSAIIVIR
jgi:hypothetical protein